MVMFSPVAVSLTMSVLPDRIERYVGFRDIGQVQRVDAAIASIVNRVAAVTGRPDVGIIDMLAAVERLHARRGLQGNTAVAEIFVAEGGLARCRDIGGIIEGSCCGSQIVPSANWSSSVPVPAPGQVLLLLLEADENCPSTVNVSPVALSVISQIAGAALDDVERHVAGVEPDEADRIGLLPGDLESPSTIVSLPSPAPQKWTSSLGRAVHRAVGVGARERACGGAVRRRGDAAVSLDQELDVVPCRAVVEHDLLDDAVALRAGLAFQDDRALTGRGETRLAV